VTTLNKYENDHRDPSADVVRKMSSIYAVSVDVLLDTKNLLSEDIMYRQKFEESQARIIELLDRIAQLEKRLAERQTPRKKRGNGL